MKKEDIKDVLHKHYLMWNNNEHPYSESLDPNDYYCGAMTEVCESYLREGLIEFCNFYKIPFSSNITELENGSVGFKIFTTEQGVDNFLSSR